MQNDASSSILNDLQPIINNDHHDEMMEYQEKQFDEDENSEIYEIETLTIPTIDISENNVDLENNLTNECLNTLEEDLEDQPPAKKFCIYQDNFENKTTESSKRINNSILFNNNSHHDYAKNSNSNEDITYNWLGDLVMEQLSEIAPKHRTDFAWDVQCLIRKYVMKSRTDNDEINSLLQSSTSKTSRDKKSKTSHDLMLPKPSNVSFNISFV